VHLGSESSAFLVACLTGILTMAGLLNVGPLLQRVGAVDVPSARSLHSAPIMRGGGLAPGASIALALGVGALGAPDGRSQALTLTVAGAVGAFGLVGWLEDFRGLGVVIRLFLQIGLSVGVTVSLYLAAAPHPWLVLPFVFFIVGYVNSTNFMDGVNGISGLHGGLCGLSFAYFGWLHTVPWLTLCGLSVATAFIAFLPWNIVSPKFFLGDVGSYALGAGVASMACGAYVSGVPPHLVAAPLLVYLWDTGTTIIRRVLAGESPHVAHNSHVYQRLVSQGMSHIGSALTVSGVTAACIALAVVAEELLGWALAGTLVLLLLGGYTALPRVVAMRPASRTG